ncbi:MAG: general secretion pathway protein GspB [Ideonella sp.]|nr:general secretion pathway protein GspB [Ideonella sp.]
MPTPDQLPEALRRELPNLEVTGSAYSADPASRMLILNGQVVHEGDALGGGVVLETIQPRSAVLRTGEQRFRIAF